MKNLVKELNNKMAGRELIYLSTFVNSKKSMSSRIEFKKIELKALNGYISIATNGSQIVRVFFKGRYFSVDALWDIFKYDAPYFNINRVKNAQKNVTIKHLQMIRTAIKNLNLKAIKDTVYLLNIASNNFNTFAAYEILSKKIFINKIADTTTRIDVGNTLKTITGNEKYIIPDYLKSYKYIKSKNITSSPKTSTQPTSINTKNVYCPTMRDVMIEAHRIRKEREAIDDAYKELSYHKRLSLALKKVWAIINSQESNASNQNNISANNITTEKEIGATSNTTPVVKEDKVENTKEDKIENTNETNKETTNKDKIEDTVEDNKETTIKDNKEDTNEEDTIVNTNDNIVELTKMKGLPPTCNMNDINSINCRTSSDCLYIEAYNAGFTVEKQNGDIITLFSHNQKNRRNNSLLLTSRKNFAIIFKKLFNADLIAIKEEGHEVYDIPKILFEGKLYNLIIMGHHDKFPKDLAVHVIQAEQL